MFEKHEEYIKKGLLSKSELGNLILYNYTDKCVYEDIWDDITLNSRGTIYNKNTGEIVSQSFPKFFNHNQDFTKTMQTPKLLGELRNLPHWVQEKVDGSL